MIFLELNYTVPFLLYKFFYSFIFIVATDFSFPFTALIQSFIWNDFILVKNEVNGNNMQK